MEKQARQVKVKTEKLATRCEICHQSDLFNPETETCSRCSQVEKALEAKPRVSQSLWSPRFRLIERENQPTSLKTMIGLMLADLIALPIVLALENYVFAIVVLCLAMILAVVYLVRRFGIEGMITSTSISNESLRENFRSNQQITTLFDKYPQDDGSQFKRNLPYGEPEHRITTLFGDNDKK